MHEQWMLLALEQAEQAAQLGEVPVGAVVVREGAVIGSGYNCPISQQDPTAHAEIRALRAAASQASNYRLPGAVLYCTVEPCAMCAGTLVHARIERLVFATREPRAGAVVSTAQLLQREGINHSVAVEEGVLAEQAAQLLSDFFAGRRAG